MKRPSGTTNRVVLALLVPALGIALSASSCDRKSPDDKAAQAAVEGYFKLVDGLSSSGDLVKQSDFQQFATPEFALNSALDRLTFRENGYTQKGHQKVDVRDVKTDAQGLGTVLVCLDISDAVVQFEGKDLPETDEPAPAETDSATASDSPGASDASVSSSSQSATAAPASSASPSAPPTSVGLSMTMTRDGTRWLIKEQKSATVSNC